MTETVWVVLLTMLWNATVLGVCAYAVFWLGHSGGWFLLAILLMWSVD
jgi:hypothetical protein